MYIGLKIEKTKRKINNLLTLKNSLVKVKRIRRTNFKTKSFLKTKETYSKSYNRTHITNFETRLKRRPSDIL